MQFSANWSSTRARSLSLPLPLPPVPSSSLSRLFASKPGRLDELAFRPDARRARSAVLSESKNLLGTRWIGGEADSGYEKWSCRAGCAGRTGTASGDAAEAEAAKEEGWSEW